jgi:hypothetical protein
MVEESLAISFKILNISYDCPIAFANQHATNLLAIEVAFEKSTDIPATDLFMAFLTNLIILIFTI